MNTPTVFISYSHQNSDDVDYIDKSIIEKLRLFGISVIRDDRDLETQSDIDDFCKKIKDSDLALIIISDAYLKSKYCMFEIMNIKNDPDFYNKIITIRTDDFNRINPGNNTEYILYWEAKRQELESKISETPPGSTTGMNNELRKIIEIVYNIDDFLDIVRRRLHFNIQDLRKNNCEQLVDFIVRKTNPSDNSIDELMSIMSKDDKEEQKLSLEKFIETHPPSFLYHLVSGHIYRFEGNFTLSKYHYEKAIEIYPTNAAAHFHLGFLYATRIRDMELALSEIEKSIVLNENDAWVRFWHVILLLDYKKDKKAAYNEFKKLISLDTGNAAYHWAFGSFLMEECHKFDKAKEELENAIQFRPKFSEAHHRLGYLLEHHFNDLVGAKFEYELAQKIKIEGSENSIGECPNTIMIRKTAHH